MKRVFEEVNANGLKLKNRLVCSATWEGLGKPDGILPEEVYDILLSSVIMRLIQNRSGLMAVSYKKLFKLSFI